YRRHAAVFILREVAIALPTYFYQHIITFFEVIFNAIFDPKPAIRESAGEALRAALIVTAQRESTKQSSEPQWYRICYDKANSSFCADLAAGKDQKGVTRDDRIHGGLIVLNELFRCANASWERRYTALKTLFPRPAHSKSLETGVSVGVGSQLNTLVPRLKVPFIDRLGGTQSGLGEGGDPSNGLAKFASHNVLESAYAHEILQEHYTTICDNVLEQRFSKSPYVQQALLQILRRLAAFDREVFVEKYLTTCVSHLMQILRGKEKDRTVAFITIGYMAVAVESAIEPHLPGIMASVKLALPAKDLASKRKVPVDPAVFACITLLAHAVKSEIAEDVRDILEQMFYTGLSPALTV
ncbi:hypothetical protein KR018_005735, partial [Drosophila ironensis]